MLISSLKHQIWFLPLLFASGWVIIDTRLSLESLPCTVLTGNLIFGLALMCLLGWGFYRKAHLETIKTIFLSLAPFAWLYPWALVPPHFPGLAVGGPEFFKEWLVKYPNLGPVNFEVLLGILCILGLGVLPVIAIYLRSRLLAVALWFVVLAMETAVLIRLDAMLLFAAAAAAPGGLATAFGPLIRLLALSFMTMQMVNALRSPVNANLRILVSIRRRFSASVTLPCRHAVPERGPTLKGANGSETHDF
jgi:hypothetical protein